MGSIPASRTNFGNVAHQVEQRIENPCVAGSSPAVATKTPLWTNFGKVASLKQRSMICQFESDQGYQFLQHLQVGRLPRLVV